MVAPGYLDRYLAHTCYNAQMTDEPADPDRPDNLYHPVDDDHDFSAHGAFDDRSRSSSWQFWADKNRNLLALAGGGLTALACVAMFSRNGKRS
jgi:hypothetical protein